MAVPANLREGSTGTLFPSFPVVPQGSIGMQYCSWTLLVAWTLHAFGSKRTTFAVLWAPW